MYNINLKYIYFLQYFLFSSEFIFLFISKVGRVIQWYTVYTLMLFRAFVTFYVELARAHTHMNEEGSSLETIPYLDLLLPQLESKTLFLLQFHISEEFQTRSFPDSNEKTKIYYFLNNLSNAISFYNGRRMVSECLNLYSPI